MKLLRFLLVGVLFGVILTKSEVVSWYRIQEMFLFDSIHMYAVIGSAVVISMLITQFIKKKQVRSVEGTPIQIKPKDTRLLRVIFGGIIFGMGWAMTGACPGPVYALIGNGYSVYILVLISALFGTLTYGMLRHKLPH